MHNWQQILLTISMRWWQFRDRVSELFSHCIPAPADRDIPPGEPPLPPASLRVRIGDPNPDNYLTTGPRVYKRLKRHLEKYDTLDSYQHVLDWGCGCGRVTRYMLQSIPPRRLHGCDIDPDAIAWMQANFPESTFTQINPEPPTAYNDNFFDLIYGISVFTHLDEATQFLWLEELKRIAKPGALVAVTVHGDTRTDPQLREKLAEKGISDREGDRSIFFQHFLNDGYYRLTKHSKDYVMKEWSRYFDILEFIERGIGRQNLVIMRKLDT